MVTIVMHNDDIMGSNIYGRNGSIQPAGPTKVI